MLELILPPQRPLVLIQINAAASGKLVLSALSAAVRLRACIPIACRACRWRWRRRERGQA